MSSTQRRRVETAQQHLETVAKGLVAIIGSTATGDLLAGAAVAVLMAGHGHETTARYLRELADEIERDGAPVGHA